MTAKGGDAPIGRVARAGLSNPDRRARSRRHLCLGQHDTGAGRDRGRRRDRARLHLFRRFGRRTDRAQLAPVLAGRAASTSPRRMRPCGAGCATSGARGWRRRRSRPSTSRLWDLKAKLLGPPARLVARPRARRRPDLRQRRVHHLFRRASCAASSPAGSSATAATGSR